MKHIISLLMENEAGALSRVAGLFSARAYNIESLTVAPTEDATLSRMTIVTSGSDEVIEQIIKQLNKLVDVVKVLDLNDGRHIERELMLVKVKATGVPQGPKTAVALSNIQVAASAMQRPTIRSTRSGHRAVAKPPRKLPKAAMSKYAVKVMLAAAKQIRDSKTGALAEGVEQSRFHRAFRKMIGLHSLADQRHGFANAVRVRFQQNRREI